MFQFESLWHHYFMYFSKKLKLELALQVAYEALSCEPPNDTAGVYGLQKRPSFFTWLNRGDI